MPRVFVLTEDSGVQARPTIHKLVKLAAQRLAPSLDTRLLDLRPIDDELAAGALQANAWKAKKGNQLAPARQALVRTIANELLQGHFVVFHVDSDTTWSKRASSDNRLKFQKQIRETVQATLTTDRGRFKAIPQQQAAALISNLISMHPCYSIESWLYQGSARLRELCELRHRKPSHLELIATWEADPSLLDELEAPKDGALSDCVGDRYNEDLVSVFPEPKVFAAARSWAEFVDLLHASEAFMRAIGDGATHAF